MLTTRLMIALTTLTLAPGAFAGPSFVGNGDGGADLEGSTPLTSGPITAARTQAADLLRRLNVQGVRGLGLLLPEVESSPLYLARGDRQPTQYDDQGAFHSDMRGLVFARTFAHPHAATRFFPVALDLTADQLVALHIHEGLHRSLPPGVAEDEARVTALTLAITAPSASFDQIQAVATREIPPQAIVAAPATEPAQAALPASVAAMDAEMDAAMDTATENVSETSAQPRAPDKFVMPPIDVSYSYTSFASSVGSSSLQRLEMETMPFPNRIPLRVAVGIGLMSSDGGAGIGPTSISGSVNLLDHRSNGIDLSVWGRSTFAFLDSQAFEQSGFARNVNSGGLTARWMASSLTFEDAAFVISGGVAPIGAPQPSEFGTFGSTQQPYAAYGSSLHNRFSMSGEYGHLTIGGFTELSRGPDANGSLPANLTLALGPSLTWTEPTFAFSADGRFICPGTEGSFGTFGDIWDQGDGTAVISGKLTLFF